MTNFQFTASDQTRIAVHQWMPSATPDGIIFIAHGLAEHGARYDQTARFFNAHGWAVFACDYRGHGQTAPSPAALGFFAPKNGWQRVVTDVQEVLAHLKNEFPALPLVLLGHSMGSYITQQMLYTAPQYLSAAIFSGANGKPSALAKVGGVIARLERLRLGQRGRSKLINALTFDKFNQQFAPPQTPFDWLSRDQIEVQKYCDDPLNGFVATTQLWVDFLAGINEIANPAHKKNIPKNLPILLIAGGRDPVCENGRGTENLAAAYRAAGLQNVTHKIYPAARHELLNEINRAEVWADLLAWLAQNL